MKIKNMRGVLGLVAVSSLIQMLPGYSYADGWQIRSTFGSGYDRVSGRLGVGLPPLPSLLTNALICAPGAGIVRNFSDPNETLACAQGLMGGTHIAQVRGEANGRHQGYIRGFAWGLTHGFNLTKADAASVIKGEALAKSGQFEREYAEGAAVARTRASGTAAPQASNTVISQFEQAINSGQMPQYLPEVPAHPFEGLSNGFSERGHVFKDERRMIDEATNEFGSIPIYNRYGELIYTRNRISPRDLYLSDGIYVFEDNWSHPNHAFDYLSRNSGLPSDYMGLKGKVIEEKGPNGQIIRREETNYYRDMYRLAFHRAYAHAVNYYFYKGYNEELGNGEMAGYSVGTTAGSRYAEQVGFARAFNFRYKDLSMVAYDEEFQKTYKTQYDLVFRDFSNNPKISYTLNEIVGGTEDGANTPGEKLGAVITLTNSGAADARDVLVELVGDVQNAQSIKVSIPPLTRKQVKTGMIAELSSRHRARETARVGVSVNGIKSYNDLTVDTVAEIQSVKLGNLDTNHGKGEITVVVMNPTTLETPANIQLTLDVPGASAPTVLSLGTLQRKETRSIQVPFSGLDPLKLIMNGTEGKITLRMNGSDTDSGSTRISVDAKYPAVASYYNAVINGDAQAIPTGIRVEDRIGDLHRKISDATMDDITRINSRSGNDWKENPSRTLLGQIALQKETQSQSDGAQARYKELGTLLDGHTKEVAGGFLGIGNNRDDYVIQVKRLNPNVKGDRKK